MLPEGWHHSLESYCMLRCSLGRHMTATFAFRAADLGRKFVIRKIREPRTRWPFTLRDSLRRAPSTRLIDQGKGRAPRAP
jgi:hypothetical protein